MCHQYGIYFEEVSRDFGMIQNPYDQFRGSQVAILYDPGMFPALLKSPNGNETVKFTEKSLKKPKLKFDFQVPWRLETVEFLKKEI